MCGMTHSYVAELIHIETKQQECVQFQMQRPTRIQQRNGGKDQRERPIINKTPANISSRKNKRKSKKTAARPTVDANTTKKSSKE